MTERDSEQPGAPRKQDDLEIPRQSFFELMPKRSFARIGMLLLLLGLVVIFQRRSASCGKLVSDIVLPSPPQTSPSENQAPRVRVAPPNPAP